MLLNAAGAWSSNEILLFGVERPEIIPCLVNKLGKVILQGLFT